ncbi:predicted protein [Plenodomus lingam JN3]|uniref:Predicted protein n=2 Tax=Leptosphaeria maculans TaxID=5022 RepID=E4ZHD6_LEPMJ|nr:predicted protein [Plenodomus lingam JN3]CBX90706.1 predicted protein [Plenodomus lingam JN3]
MVFATHRYHFVFLAFLVVFSAILFFQRNENVFSAGFSRKSHSPPRLSTTDTFANLFRPIKLSPTHPGYRDVNGHFIPGAPADEVIWTRPLGKKVLIVDIDTRMPTGENQIFNTEKKINWERLEYHDAGLVTGGISLHYLYAMIHGYDYMHYQALEMHDIHQTWIKPHVFKELLPDYQFVVFFDADSVVAHLEIPLEWMFNRWKITKNTMIAMPHDTEEWRNGNPISQDSTGIPVQNSGFVVLQNSSLTFDMLSAWAGCTTEERYKGCAVWKHEWSHEQRAFAEFIRHDPEFNVAPDGIVEIPCDDAMGWEGFKEQVESAGDAAYKVADCNGRLVRHYTLGKERLKEEGSGIVMQSLMEIVQKNIIKHQAATYKKEHDPTMVEDYDKDTDYDEIEKLNSAKMSDKNKDEAKKGLDKVLEGGKLKDNVEKLDDKPGKLDDKIDNAGDGDEEEEDEDEYEDEDETDTDELGRLKSIKEKLSQQNEAKKKELETWKKEQELKKQEDAFMKKQSELKEKEEELKQKEAVMKKNEEEQAKRKEEKAKEREDNKENAKENEKKMQEEEKEDDSSKNDDVEKKDSAKEKVKKKENRGETKQEFRA